MLPELLDLHTEASVAAPRITAPPHLVDSARATWLGRMVNEHGSARVFEALATQMRAAGLEASLAEQCGTFAAEERTHGLLCGAVVEALGGRATAPALPPEEFPLHEDATPVEGVLRNVLSICCLSETVAVSLIGAERAEMPDGALRDLLTRIWADEVGHARFGWVLAPRLVAGLTAAEKRRVSAYLAVAFAHLERHELAHLPLHASPPPEGAALGLCSGRDARTLLYATLSEVIVPQLDALGLGASQAWRERAS